MSIFFKGFSAIIDVLQGRGIMPDRWRDPSECRDFEKVSLDFAGYQITVAKQYEAAFNSLNFWVMINNLEQHITRVDSFACRVYSATNPTWSYHSFGQAIDINPSDFPAKRDGRYLLPVWYETLLDSARACGFRVGADWQSYFDPMHIEIGSRLR